jgi:predicted nucleotidyltransferase
MNGELNLDLPSNVNSVLTEFVASAKRAFGSDLRSIILYGSAAEGRLRPTSDVNVILLLSDFDPHKADQLRSALSFSQAAIQLRVMFLLETELQAALHSFAVKFADVLRRRVVIYGDDPFAGISVSRDDTIIRLKQTLLNQTLRLRQAYVSRGLREEQLAATIADAAGPLRSSAAALLELEGTSVSSGKEALEKVAASLPGGPQRTKYLNIVAEARQRQTLPPGVAGQTLLHLIELARLMSQRVDKLT